MTNKKSTKKALITSALCLLLCVSMLVGATFAWFTDSVSSAKNQIVAGNLDVELEYAKVANGVMSGWTTVEGAADIFDPNALWEPGRVEVVYLKVSNLGTLALKYQLGVNVYGETAGINVAGEEFKLSDHLVFKTVEMPDSLTTYTDREAAQLASGTEKGLKDYNGATTALEVGGVDYLALIVYMPETVGNEANYRGEAIPTIELGINLFATQQVAESDSFGPDYDEEALHCDILATPETIDGILASVEPGTIIGLAAGYYDEIVLTQDNLTLVSNTAVVGFLNLNAKDGATIDGLTFDESGAQQTYTFKTGNKQEATPYVANITGDTNSPKAADNLVIKNCTFTNTSGVAAAAAAEYIPIYFNEQGAATERATNITIDNCVFACNATQYIGLNYLSVGNVAITNNTFGGGAYGTSHNTINATGNAANWTITGNSFNNWNVEKTAIGSSKQGSNTVTWTVTDNEFNHKDGAVVLALKTSYTANNSVVTVANNTVLNGNGTIVTTDVDAEGDATYAGHKIQVNEGITAVTSSDELKNALTNGATVYLTEGEYSLPSLSGKEGITIIGAEGAVIGGENASTGFGSNFGKNTTIKNVTFSGSSNGVRYSYAQGGTTIFENCTFAGDSTYGFHIDESKGATFIFNNCTFSGFNAFAGDLVKVTFNGCTFLHNGSYGHTNIWSVGEFNNCTWGEGATYGTRGDGVIYIDGFAQQTAATQDELKNAIATADKVEVTLSAGEYKLPASTNKTVIISGTADTVIDISNGTSQMHGMSYVFDGVTIKGATVNYKGIFHASNVTYKNCTLTGLQFLYAETVTFENCDFDSNGEEHSIWTYGAKNVSFVGCDFTYTDRAVNVYLDNGKGSAEVSFAGCTFTTNNAASKGAVEINSSAFPQGVNVSFDDCTAPEYGTMVGISGWDSAKGANATVTVDGAAFTAPQWAK